MAIKLIMLDLDGTLLTDDKHITEETVVALRKAKEQGISIGLATGRPKRAIDLLIEEQHIQHLIDYTVGQNGVEIVDYNKNCIRHANYLSAKSVREIALQLENFVGNIVVYHENQRYVRFMDEREREYAKKFNYELFVYDFLSNQREWAKLLVMSPQVFTDEEIAFLKHIKSEAYHGFLSSPFCFEIVHAQVSKAKGIQMLCDQLGIDMQQVMAFGDSGNDIEMLQSVGLGVAMGNALEEVKQVAKVVTASNEENGVARFIHQYLQEV